MAPKQPEHTLLGNSLHHPSHEPVPLPAEPSGIARLVVTAALAVGEPSLDRAAERAREARVGDAGTASVNGRSQ